MLLSGLTILSLAECPNRSLRVKNVLLGEVKLHYIEGGVRMWVSVKRIEMIYKDEVN